MATHVAFLRGINVGGHTVTNQRLGELLEQLNFAAVTPFLASGNVLFEATDADALERRIEAQLHEGLGYAVPAFVRSAEELVDVANHDPFPDGSEGGKLHIGFLREPLDPGMQDEVVALADDTDRVAFHGRELYWHVADRFMDSALSRPTVSKVLGEAWTVRTANTVRRLATKLPS